MNPPGIIRYKEATELIARVTDANVRAALQYALTTILTKRGMSDQASPAGEFDLCFYLEAVKAMFDNAPVIRAIVDGNVDDLRWWDDD